MTDIKCQAMQQKMQAEIKVKKQQHLTIYQKSSGRDDDDDRQEGEEGEVAAAEEDGRVDEGLWLTTLALKSMSFKSAGTAEEGSNEEEDVDENDIEALDEGINCLENFKVAELLTLKKGKLGIRANEITIPLHPMCQVLGGEVIEVELSNDSHLGLGVALSGHADRHKMGTYICGVNPGGSAAKLEKKLQPGDKLLKVCTFTCSSLCHGLHKLLISR